MANGSSLNSELSKKTGVFGLKLWAVLAIAVGAFIVLILFCLSLWLSARKKSKDHLQSGVLIPKVSKEIEVEPPGKSPSPRLLDVSKHSPSDISEDKPVEQEIAHVGQGPTPSVGSFESSRSNPEAGKDIEETGLEIVSQIPSKLEADESRLEMLTGEKVSVEGEGREQGSSASGDSRSVESPALPLTAMPVPEVPQLGWGHWYTLRELEDATDSFSDTCVLGEGGYGIVYCGGLPDGTRIAVKNLLNNRGQAEREFKVEVEAIGRVRHKNLVRLLGYCMEGSQR